MTSLKPLPWPAVAARPPWRYAVRRTAAATLRSASAALAHVALRLAVPPARPVEPVPAVLEFYADAGAPEGALYMDGKLVGWVPGVKRL
jgi:hypothetical protein